MSRILGPLGLVGTTALALALSTPALAHADRWGADDPAGDVRGTLFHPEPPPCGTRTDLGENDRPNLDIDRLGVRHTRRSLVVTARFTDLDRTTEQSLFSYVRTPSGAYWMSMHRFQTHRGRWRVTGYVGEEPPLSGDQTCDVGLTVVDQPCPRVRPTVDFSQEKMTLTVARRCLGYPRWVRVAARSHDIDYFTQPDQPGGAYFQDAWDGGVELTPGLPHYGPRVRATRGAAHRIAFGPSGTTRW
jgi:hypothetical protein